MKKLKSKIILITLVILIVIIFLFQIQKNPNITVQEEFIFFKLFSRHQEEKEVDFLSEKQENSTYDFQVAYQNIDFKDIYLADTIKTNTRVQEKENFQFYYSRIKKLIIEYNLKIQTKNQEIYISKSKGMKKSIKIWKK